MKLNSKLSHAPVFDDYAANYEVNLNKGLFFSGEKRDYFAQGRVEWLKKTLEKINFIPHRVMDFGCGIGTNTGFLSKSFPDKPIIGVDVSKESLECAKKTFQGPQNKSIHFVELADFYPQSNEKFDLLFTNGVFHHIASGEQSRVLQYLFSALQEGGLIALWENNPWNLGTRLVMKKIPFDKDANPMSVLEIKSMLKKAGFEVLKSDFLFIFPKILKFLRKLEPWVCQLPLGAQFQVLARKPKNG